VAGGSTALKNEVLKLLEEDREFRYAMMGLLGFKEILDRITKLEERQQKLEERQQILEERFARIEERQQKLEERFTELEERQQKLEERFAQLEERFAKLEERVIRLEERMEKLEVRVTRVEESLEKLSRAVVTIGNRFGILAESVFREALAGILRRYFGADARRWSCIDEEGIVYGYRSLIEVDVVVKDGAHILVEVKSRADPSDIIELIRIGELYEKVTGVKPKLAIVAGYVRKKTYEVATKHGVEVYTYLEE